VRLEKKLKIETNRLTYPRRHNIGAVRMLDWRVNSLMRMIALCADAKEAELEGE